MVGRLRVRRDVPGALVALQDGRYAVTGPIVFAGGREDVASYARRRIDEHVTRVDRFVVAAGEQVTDRVRAALRPDGACRRIRRAYGRTRAPRARAGASGFVLTTVADRDPVELARWAIRHGLVDL